VHPLILHAWVVSGEGDAHPHDDAGRAQPSLR